MRIGVVLGTVTMLVVALAGPAAAKTVSPEKYAKSLCSTLGDVFGSQDELVDAYNAVPADDSVAFQSQTVDLVNGFVADLEAGEAKLKKLTPDVKRGKKVARLFIANLDRQSAAIQAAIDTFARADPNGVTFQMDVTAFGVSLDSPGSQPFSEVTNQDLLEAFDEEPSCEEIVTVF